MQSQHHVQNSGSNQAQAARLLLQANLAYGESNSNGLSHIQRLRARQECRDCLADAFQLEPENAGALGLLGRIEFDEGASPKLINCSAPACRLSPGKPSSTPTWVTGL